MGKGKLKRKLLDEKINVHQKNKNLCIQSTALLKFFEGENIRV